MFLVHSRQVADTNPLEYHEGATGIGVGVACKMNAGKLAKCAATDKPAYIVRGQLEDGRYQAERVTPLTEYRCPVAGSPVAGTAVTLGTDAASVTATTTEGVFTLTRVAGDTAYGYFA